MLDAITIDGEVLKIPTAVHIDGMVYYNKEVAEEAGVDPTKWTSLDDMWADEKKVEDAGYHLHRHRRQHLPGRLHLPRAARRRSPARTSTIASTPARTASRTRPCSTSRALRDAIEMFRKIAAQTDEGWVNRAWNDTTNTVIAGNALMQIHGDWMKGQWRANGKKAGVDFGCINIPGTKALSVTVDSFGILGGVDDATLKAEEDFAATVVDPKINAEFAYLQGLEPGAHRRADRQARRVQHAGARVAEEARTSASRTRSTSPTPTGSIRSGTRCSPSRATRT